MKFRYLVLAVVGIMVASHAAFALESSASVLRPGQWIEVRGAYNGEGIFKAARAELIQPDRYQVIIGTVSSQDEQGNISLLDQHIEIQDKTDIDRLPRDGLAGQRVKVEGYYRGPRKFSAREVDPRGEGRERILGRIDAVKRHRGSLVLEVMNFRVEVPGDVLIEHEFPLSEYQSTAPLIGQLLVENRDDDDLFGDGYWISENLQVSGQAQVRGIGEREFNLNERDAENRDDLESTVRARFVYQPSDSFFAVAEINYRQLWRSDEDDGRFTDGNSKLGEAYFYWRKPRGKNFNVQVGRIDFDDPREFLYDQNLDAVRFSWDRKNWRAEWSYSETLSDGSPVDESAGNSILYISNRDDDRHLAAYLIHREFDLPVDTRRTHIGLRALGEWLPDQESWLELSYMDGRTANVDTRGLAWDIGTSWQFHEQWSLTLGHAWAQGNRPGGSDDRTYRQSGLQDNNAKFLGVTSFRYYGELVDPELANLGILTAGIGFHPRSNMSLDLVWHQYRQDQPSTRLAESDLDKRPNGIYRALGEELDLVFGWRTDHDLDIEIVAARFSPGPAFGRADTAYLGKVQLRYRF